jgi:nitroimidazol reductase NimA-like FMN-containing flavoprotein (pyridoxamine 5'-phosphate oxidase superfamily)
MGVSLSEDEAWSFIESSITGIVTTMRADGFPLALPVWFVALDHKIYVRTPAASKKINRIRNNSNTGFLVESGERWRDLTAVSFAAEATFVDDDALCNDILDARAQKYKGLGSGGSRTLPPVAVKHYSSRPSIVRLTPVGRLISWDNRKMRLIDGTTD